MKKELLLAAMGISCFASGEEKIGVDTGTGALQNSKTNDVPAKLQTPDLEKLLAHVAATPTPKHVSLGASCYRSGVRIDREEYVCPRCGSKEIHVIENKEEYSKSSTYLAIFIPKFRQYVYTLNKLGLDIKLDESCLCKKCNKEGEDNLFVEVTYKERKTRSTLESIDELQMLIAFLEGKIIWTGDQGEEHLIKPNLPRIRTLLGIEDALKEIKNKPKEDKLPIMADCYAMSIQPARIETIDPDSGLKTLFVFG